jgi:hypothetical protein
VVEPVVERDWILMPPPHGVPYETVLSIYVMIVPRSALPRRITNRRRIKVPNARDGLNPNDLPAMLLLQPAGYRRAIVVNENMIRTRSRRSLLRLWQVRGSFLSHYGLHL